MDLLTAISDNLWNPMAYFALAVGLFFTVVTRAAQFRLIGDTLRQILKPKADHGGGISPLQALLLTISSRVGVGNIAGVGTAVAAGGPGALLWMVVCALLGSASSFAESSLAQVFKRKINGEHRGGMPFYVKHGLRIKWLAAVLAVMTMLGYGFLFPGVQSNNIAGSLEHAFGLPVWVSAIAVTALLGFVILGGTRRIVHAAQFMVPLMAVGYILVAFIIVIINLEDLLPTLGLIISSAFGANEVFAGMAGYAIAWGVRRAVFSNVAGVGEGTYGSAAASVTHPAKQGLVQSFSIFIDTVVVCFATGIMIVMTGSYNVFRDSGDPVVTNLEGIEAGSAYTQEAVNSALPGFGPGFVAIALFFFAFTTLVAFYYIAHTNLVFLVGREPGPILNLALKLGMLAITFYGAVESADVMWTVGDIGYASLGWINMVCLLLLSPVVYKVIRDYDRQRTDGLDPVFDPTALGITGADFWVQDHPAGDRVDTDAAHGGAEPGSYTRVAGKAPRD
ncbi:alanine:cation symporter family protein (plasmid) [Citricoccus sp. SGAir0253]|uniref:alanine/glycine:cation symporter family protein n=1 Tax=Citricoccus sp. SGAir0253 TaxID=2567881 RepID=UPI0010CD233A|nr:alanine/glycine:cation symporter family protein [Citricoccus sp. SGAir0253]QCU79638.1 alanine:cation symporter family protein [Citricoccus sp. SGAir0253]